MLYQNLKEIKIVLGSGSPRRKYLLEEMGLEFKVMVNSGLEESWPDGLSKEEIPVYLAELKARHLMEMIPEGSLLITADTIVWLNGQVINKPDDDKDAFRMLRALSGAEHEVLTGVSFTMGNARHSFVASSHVRFANLSDQEIDFYIKNYNPHDKAGAYGIQDWIGYIGVEEIRGSYFNVMGLPLQRMYHELKLFLEDE